MFGPPESTVNWPGRRREEGGSEHIAHIRVIQVLPVAENWIDEDAYILIATCIVTLVGQEPLFQPDAIASRIIYPHITSCYSIKPYSNFSLECFIFDNFDRYLTITVDNLWYISTGITSC